MNASLAIMVTLFGIVILASESHHLNAYAPILVTLLGIVIRVNEVHPLNAYQPMLVTLPSSGIMLSLHPAIRVFVFVSIIQLPVL